MLEDVICGYGCYFTITKLNDNPENFTDKDWQILVLDAWRSLTVPANGWHKINDEMRAIYFYDKDEEAASSKSRLRRQVIWFLKNRGATAQELREDYVFGRSEVDKYYDEYLYLYDCFPRNNLIRNKYGDKYQLQIERAYSNIEDEIQNITSKISYFKH